MTSPFVLLDEEFKKDSSRIADSVIGEIVKMTKSNEDMLRQGGTLHFSVDDLPADVDVFSYMMEHHYILQKLEGLTHKTCFVIRSCIEDDEDKHCIMIQWMRFQEQCYMD